MANTYFLRMALNAVRKHRGLPEIDAMDFLALVEEKAALVEMEDALLSRTVNEGFSGGEKKRNEIFQMAVLDPTLAILDETDSGLDIDALRVVASGVNSLRSAGPGDAPHHPLPAAPQLHHPRRHPRPLRTAGSSASGDKSLALLLEEKGYGWLEEEAAVGAGTAS